MKNFAVVTVQIFALFLVVCISSTVFAQPFDLGAALRYTRFSQMDSSIAFIGIGDSVMYGEFNMANGNLKWVKVYNIPTPNPLLWNVHISNELPDGSLIHSMEDRYNGSKTYLSRINKKGNIIHSLSISPSLKVEKIWADTSGIINVLGGDTLRCGYYVRLDSTMNVLSNVKFDSIKTCDIVYNKSDIILLGSVTSMNFYNDLAIINLDSSLNIKDHRYYTTCGSTMKGLYYQYYNDGITIESIKLDTTELTIFYSLLEDDVNMKYSSMWVKINLASLNPVATQCWPGIGVLGAKKLSDSTALIVGTNGLTSTLFKEAPFFQVVKNNLPFVSDTGFVLKPNRNVKYFHEVFKTKSGYIFAGLGFPFSEVSIYGMTNKMETTCNKTIFNMDTSVAKAVDTSVVVNSSSMLIQTSANVLTSFNSWIKLGNVCSSVSVEEYELENIKIFPNPSQGKVTITANDVSGPYQLQILNMLGDAVLTKNGTFNGSVHIQHALLAGVYLLQLQVGEERFSSKLIVNGR